MKTFLSSNRYHSSGKSPFQAMYYHLKVDILPTLLMLSAMAVGMLFLAYFLEPRTIFSDNVVSPVPLDSQVDT